MTTDPFFGRNPIIRELVRQRSQASQSSENSARVAWAWARVQTVGSGEIEIPDAQAFGVTFANVPDIAHGVYLDPATPLQKGRFPRVTAGVVRWVQNTAGMYTGAYLYVVVDTSGPDADPGTDATGTSTLYGPPPSYVLHHTFTFSAMAIKDLPVWKLD